MATALPAKAEPATSLEQALAQLKNTVDAGTYQSRHDYEIAFPGACRAVIKDINPKCPDQRGEISFSLAEVSAKLDSFTFSIEIKARPDSNDLTETRYYRTSLKGRRFCDGNSSQALKSDRREISQTYLLYTDDPDLLEALEEAFGQAIGFCRTPAQ
jgi:hypothetical protein